MSLLQRLLRPRPPRNAIERGARLVEGRVALVTGGAGVVGAAICRTLAREGAAVAIGYRSHADRAHALAAELTQLGARAGVWQADVRDESQARALVTAAHAALGGIDILVNNAAHAAPPRPFVDRAWADYEEQIDVILKGAVLCSRAAVPLMTARGAGRIINIGTTAVDQVRAAQAAYVAAKAALTGLTRSLAEELGPFGITVNQVVPGLMWTHDREPADGDAVPFRRLSPLRPGLARPEHVADAVAFLASDRAAMITGAYLPVAAGMVMPDPM